MWPTEEKRRRRGFFSKWFCPLFKSFNFHFTQDHTFEWIRAKSLPFFSYFMIFEYMYPIFKNEFTGPIYLWFPLWNFLFEIGFPLLFNKKGYLSGNQSGIDKLNL